MTVDRLRRPRDDERGFTLLELLVVVVIIGILAAIAIPVFLDQRQKGYEATEKGDLRNLANFEEIYLDDYGIYASYAQLLASEPEMEVSSGDHVVIEHYNGAIGYCLSASYTGSPYTWYYDSNAGGLQPRGTACTAVTTGPNGGGN